MTTSSNGNVFRVTGPLCGEFTGHWWIPLTKVRAAELWSFLWSASWINDWSWWFETPSRSLWRHCNEYAQPVWIMILLLFTLWHITKGTIWYLIFLKGICKRYNILGIDFASLDFSSLQWDTIIWPHIHQFSKLDCATVYDCRCCICSLLKNLHHWSIGIYNIHTLDVDIHVRLGVLNVTPSYVTTWVHTYTHICTVYILIKKVWGIRMVIYCVRNA